VNPVNAVADGSELERHSDKGEQGAGTVLAVAMIGIVVTVTVGTAGAVGVVAGHRRAQSAADLSALAGATTLQSGGDPCQRADAIAGRNGAELRRCQVDGAEVVVVVARSVRLPGLPMDLEARARAGPAENLPASQGSSRCGPDSRSSRL
jgi:secretion/DNA translocation related TadE-like protein